MVASPLDAGAGLAQDVTTHPTGRDGPPMKPFTRIALETIVLIGVVVGLIVLLAYFVGAFTG